MKPGDRVRVIGLEHLTGTIKSVDGSMVWLVLDPGMSVMGELDGEPKLLTEGDCPDDMLELIESSDWADLWEKSSK